MFFKFSGEDFTGPALMCHGGLLGTFVDCLHQLAGTSKPADGLSAGHGGLRGCGWSSPEAARSCPECAKMDFGMRIDFIFDGLLWICD